MNIQSYTVIKSLNDEENRADTKGQLFYTLLSLQIEKIVYFLSPRIDPTTQHITTISNYRLEEKLHLEISEKQGKLSESCWEGHLEKLDNFSN